MSHKCEIQCLYMHPIYDDKQKHWKIKCDYFGTELFKVDKEMRENCTNFKNYILRNEGVK